jgi:LPS-assembly lipoprotein
LSRIAGLFAVLFLAACGFQLRGEASTGLKSLYVSTAAPSTVAVELRRQVTGSSTRLAATAKEGEAHLRILSESTDKTIQTLTGAGRVFDYRLRLKVEFQVTDAGEKPIVPPSEIELWRIISYSESAPLAKEAEEQLLFADMRNEVATRILRRIAVTRASASQQSGPPQQ